MLKVIYTRKQAGVIYRNVKEGNLNMSKAAINMMYYWAGLECYPDTARMLDLDMIKAAVDNVFAGDLEVAQVCLDKFAEFVA